MSNPGSDLAAMRKPIWHICPVCRHDFLALRTAVYCSNRCRQAAKYQRFKASSPG